MHIRRKQFRGYMVNRTSFLKKKSGNAEIAALVFLGVCGIVIYTMSDFFKDSKFLNKKTDSIALLQIVEDSVIWSIENDDAWKATLAANSASMSCLSTEGAICPTGTQPLIAYLADGTLAANGAASDSSGFDYYGTACTGFSQTTPNDLCPFKIVMTWTPNCTGTCPATTLSVANAVAIRPPVTINVSILFSGSNDIYKHTNLSGRFTKTFVRGSIQGSLAASCRAVNGSFDPTSQTCQLQKIGCGTGTVLTGFDATGNPVCSGNKFLNSGCGSGFAPVKVAAGGGFLCWKF